MMKMNYVLSGIEIEEAKALLRRVLNDCRTPEDGYVAHKSEGYIAGGEEIFSYDRSYRIGHIDRYCSGLYLTYSINKYRATSKKWGIFESKTNALNEQIPRCEIKKEPIGDRAFSIIIKIDY